ncbi:MAG: hypothetical protein D6812_06890, partial [Deltaproteobacteria bacterium]
MMQGSKHATISEPRGTPVRRKPPKKIFDRKSTFFSVAVLLLFGILLFVELRGRPTPPPSDGGSGGVRLDYRALAGKLKAVGLHEAAAQAYERYLEVGRDLTPESAARIAYTLGKLYLDAGKFEAALDAFYRAELYDPDSELSGEIDAKIVHCLERLGRGVAAQYALDARTRVGGKGDETKRSEAVVARIGADTITRRQIEEAFAALPPYLRKRFEGKEGKRAFAEKFVAEELLFRKARKLEYDKDPE